MLSALRLLRAALDRDTELAVAMRQANRSGAPLSRPQLKDALQAADKVACGRPRASSTYALWYQVNCLENQSRTAAKKGQ